jgi:hypothetical protein
VLEYRRAVLEYRRAASGYQRAVSVYQYAALGYLCEIRRPRAEILFLLPFSLPLTFLPEADSVADIEVA